MLTERIRREFSQEIATQQLIVVEAAVTQSGAADQAIDFFVYSGPRSIGHVWSSVVEPSERDRQDFDRVTVQATTIRNLVSQYGDPFFIKIDVEHHDAMVLADVFESQIQPQFLSVEAHDPSVMAILLLQDEYRAFQFVQGKHVSIDFGNYPVATESGLEFWEFARHSAGPFGEDLPGPWLDRASALRQFGTIGPGWVDVHVARDEVGEKAEPQGSSPSRRIAPSQPIIVPPNGVAAPLALAFQFLMTAFSRIPSALTTRLKPRRRRRGTTTGG
jgi:hypothetical protein